jgi:hypothetical protein
VYTSKIATIKKSIASKYKYNGDTYKDIFVLLTDVQNGIQNELNEQKINEKAATASEKVTIFNADGSTSEKSLGQLMYYETAANLLNEINGELTNLNNYVSKVREILEESEKIFFNNDVINDVVEEIVLTQQKDGLKYEGLSELVTQKMNLLQGKLIARKNSNSKLETFEREAIRIKIYVEALQSLGNVGNISRDGYFMEQIAFGIGKAMNRFGGLLYEQLLADMINATKQGDLKAVKAGIESGQYSEISKATVSSSEEYQELNTKMVRNTADVGLFYQANNDNGEATFQMRLPGISVKKVSISGSNNEAKIKIQSDTTLKDVLLRSKIAGTRQYYVIVNVLAHYGTGEGVSRSLYQNVYDYIAAKNIINSLVGTRQVEDFSYFLVINDKIFNVVDILKELKNNSGDFKIKMSFSPSQTSVAKQLSQY